MTGQSTPVSGSDPSDVWAKAQGSRASLPAGLLCYVDGDAVGFDVRLALPPVCLRCGGTSKLETRRHVVRLEADLATLLAMALQGSQRSDLRLQPGERLELVLPVCASCLADQRRTTALRWVLRTSFAWWLALVLVTNAISPALGGPVAFGLLPVIALLAVWTYIRRGRELRLERIDSDGTVRLAGVHPDAAETIQAASAGAGHVAQDARVPGPLSDEVHG